eukprot:2318346-Rhodomonas_salina.1
MASERGAAVAWAFMVLALLVLASQLREGSMDAAGRVELAASAAAASTTPTQTTTDAPQNYGPYYGPQAYYDGELHALSLPQSLNLSRCLLDLEGGYYQTDGKAFASPYDRYERHREYRNYVGGYLWDNQQRTQAAQRQLRDQQNWQYAAALKKWYADYASQQQQ